jgi:hypothetical protein
MANQLDHAQLYALEVYAREHGRNWKSKLNLDWMTGGTTGTLQQIRNSFGPTWLTRFNLKRELASDWYRRVSCDQCQMLAINGVACHETGCPNMGARWDRENQVWVKQRKCFDCGYMVDLDDMCCSAPMEGEDE